MRRENLRRIYAVGPFADAAVARRHAKVGEKHRTTVAKAKNHQRASAHDTRLEGELALATAACALAVLAGAAAERWLHLSDLSLVFMTAVIAVSVRTRRIVAIYAALLAALAYNYFFLEPRFTLYLATSTGLATVGLFLVAALVCGRLANRLRAQLLLVQTGRRNAEALRDLGMSLLSATTEADAVVATAKTLRDTVDCDAVVLMRNEPGWREAGRNAANTRFDPALILAADASLRSGAEERAGDGPWHCIPLGRSAQPFGVLGVRFEDQLLPPIEDAMALVEAMARDLAQALTRLSLDNQLAGTRLQAETERLRAELLASISHDLRSPLSTIIGSAESLVAYRAQLSSDDQVALARDIAQEGQRLDRYIQNLLDMTRLGHDGLQLHRDWIGLDEVLGAAMTRLRRQATAPVVKAQLPPGMPLLRVHAPLFEQALFNVLDNAAKFSPPGAPISVQARSTGESIIVEISDRGPGIPEGDRERVFERFHRVAQGDRAPPGTGLGLAICRGVLVAHGGSAEALAGVDGIGTVVRLRLPREAPPADASSMDE
jgi:two-component system sensor histidine kinase KdpD